METTQRRILILRGIPASGKSTYAEELVKQGYNRVNKDSIRHMINGYKLNNADEAIVHRVQTDIIKTLMRDGRNFVIDNTHTKTKYVNDLMKLINGQQEWMNTLLDDDNNRIHDYDYEVSIKIFDTPLEECLERNAQREVPVFEEVIKRMHQQLFS